MRRVEQRQALVGAVELGECHHPCQQHAPGGKRKGRRAHQHARQHRAPATCAGHQRGRHRQAAKGGDQGVAGVVAQLPWSKRVSGGGRRTGGPAHPAGRRIRCGAPGAGREAEAWPPGPAGPNLFPVHRVQGLVREQQRRVQQDDGGRHGRVQGGRGEGGEGEGGEHKAEAGGGDAVGGHPQRHPAHHCRPVRLQVRRQQRPVHGGVAVGQERSGARGTDEAQAVGGGRGEGLAGLGGRARGGPRGCAACSRGLH